MPDGRWMLFVDGENFAKRGREVLAAHGVEPVDGRFWRPDVYLWLPEPLRSSVGRIPDILAQEFVRGYYYTSCPGDESARLAVRDALRAINFDAEVFYRPAGRSGRTSKGVDIALTTEMLSHAHLDNFGVAVLAAGDGDYAPLVEAVKRRGKRVHGLFFDSGTSPALVRACDSFTYWDDQLRGRWQRAIAENYSSL